jgi:hypothetical protein
LLEDFFGERGFWTPRSPDLTQSDFLMCGFLKERFYSNNPRRSEEMRHNTEQNVANIDPEAIRKVERNTLKIWMLIFASAFKLFSKFFLTNKN